MTTHFRATARTLLTIALLAPLSSFAIGRDLTGPRTATPDYATAYTAVGATENGFLLAWSSSAPGGSTRGYGTTTDAEGVPRLPAPAMSSLQGALIPNGNGFLSISVSAILDLDAKGAVRSTVAFDQPLEPFNRAAFDGTNFFVLLLGNGHAGLLIDRNGHVLARTTLPIADASQEEIAPSPNGGFTVIAAEAATGVHALQISASGEVTGTMDLDPPRNPIAGFAIAIATNGNHTVAAWTSAGSNSAQMAELRGGSVLRRSTLPSTPELSSGVMLKPSGDGFLLLRSVYAATQTGNSGAVQASRLDSAGTPRDLSATQLARGAVAGAATSHTIVLLCGGGATGNLIEVSAAMTDSGIVPLATYDIVATSVRQITPSVASDGVDFFAAWTETTSTATRIVAGRVTRSGLPLDGTGIVVADASNSTLDRVSNPAVAFGAGAYLVVFTTGLNWNGNLMGRRFARDGAPIDAGPFLIARNAGAASVAFGGTRFLVAWPRYTGWSLIGTTVAADGSTAAEQQLTPPLGQETQEEYGEVERPMIGWNGRHFIVTYIDGSTRKQTSIRRRSSPGECARFAPLRSALRSTRTRSAWSKGGTLLRSHAATASASSALRAAATS